MSVFLRKLRSFASYTIKHAPYTVIVGLLLASVVSWCGDYAKLAVILVVGNLLCQATKVCLRSVFGEECTKRPKCVHRLERGGDFFVKETSGMPSGHSFTMFLFAALITLYIYRRGNLPRTAVTAVVVFLLAVVVSVQRVRENYHTHAQVVVGAVFGALSGAIAVRLV